MDASISIENHDSDFNEIAADMDNSSVSSLSNCILQNKFSSVIVRTKGIEL